MTTTSTHDAARLAQTLTAADVTAARYRTTEAAGEVAAFAAIALDCGLIGPGPLAEHLAEAIEAWRTARASEMAAHRARDAQNAPHTAGGAR